MTTYTKTDAAVLLFELFSEVLLQHNLHIAYTIDLFFYINGDANEETLADYEWKLKELKTALNLLGCALAVCNDNTVDVKSLY